MNKYRGLANTDEKTKEELPTAGDHLLIPSPNKNTLRVPHVCVGTGAASHTN